MYITAVGLKGGLRQFYLEYRDITTEHVNLRKK